MIVVDPHAFEDLWPALGVWLLLFVTAGDGVTLLRRQAALRLGTPVEVVITDKKRESPPLLGRARRNYAYFRWDGGAGKEPVGSSAGWTLLAPRQKRPAHLLKSSAFLDDDFGYSRFKLGLFGAAFIALWAWAAARYRFG
jgi:hypothetical protein